MLSLMAAILRRLLLAALGVGLMWPPLWTLLGLVGLTPRSPLFVHMAPFHLSYEPWGGLEDPVRMSWVALGWLVVGATITGLALLVPVRGRDARFVLERGQSGSIAITHSTVRQIVRRAGESIDGVRLLRSRSRLRRAGWVVRGEAELWADAQVASTARELHDAVVEALASHTGLPVHKVEIALDLDSPEEHKAPR